jgi:ketosteroid isomerase-like protein
VTIVSKVAQRRANTEILEQMLMLLGRMDLEGVFELWADDGALEMPFLPDLGRRRTAPTSAVKEFFRATNEEALYKINLTIVAIHPMLDPDSLVAEYTGEATVRGNGNIYRNDYLGLFRFRDAKIVLWREYMDAIQSLYWDDQASAVRSVAHAS